MNFDEAIAAHASWKNKLKSYIAKPDRSLKASEVGANDRCKLGQWLVGEGKQHSKLPAFSKLVEQHTRFHKAAATIITRADQGQKVESEVALGSRSEFSDSSAHVVQAILELKRSVN